MNFRDADAEIGGRESFVDASIGRHEMTGIGGDGAMKEIAKKYCRQIDSNLLVRSGGLSGIFPPTIGCLFEDIDEVLRGEAPLEFGVIYLEKLEGIIKEFKGAFTQERYFPMHVLVKYYLDLLEYPTAELKEYFNNPEISPLTPKKAGVFVYFIREHTDLLMQVAREIDQISQ